MQLGDSDKTDLFSHLSETTRGVNKFHQVFWIKQSSNKASDTTTIQPA